MSLNPDVTSVTSFTILNSGLDDLSSSTLRYRYRSVASSKKSRFLRLLHYIVFKVRSPLFFRSLLSVSPARLTIIPNDPNIVNSFFQLFLIFFALISFNSEQPILLVQRLFSALQLPDAFQLA